MRFAILADIHGNLPALEAVVDDLSDLSIDEVWVGGDLVGRGPEGDAVVRRIRQLGWPTIGGNHEDYLLDFHHRRVPEEWWHEEEWAASRWMAAELSTETLGFIEALPFTMARPGLRLVHGTPESNRKGIGPWTTDPGLLEIFESVDESLLVCAHTHRPLIRQVGDRQVVNTGSVGLPFNRDPRAQYAIFTLEDGTDDRWVPELRQVEYDRDEIFAIYDRTGFLAEGGVTAQLLRLELEHASPILVPFLAWAKHFEVRPTLDRLDDFFQVFDPDEPLRNFFARLQAL